MTIRGTKPPEPPRYLGELAGEIRRAGWVAGYQAAIDKEERDWSTLALIDPVKSCCGHRASEHVGPTCPDGLTMCCICFDRVPLDRLFAEDDGVRWDMCADCGEKNR